MNADDMEGTDMNVTREIILDLLPAYLSGEASRATCSLVEDNMRQDPELAQRIRLQWAESIAKVAPSALPADLDLRACDFRCLPIGSPQTNPGMLGCLRGRVEVLVRAWHGLTFDDCELSIVGF